MSWMYPIAVTGPAATTVAPTTAAPTSAAPTTGAPTTVPPTTPAPTTPAPTTLAPTTAAPTTAAGASSGMTGAEGVCSLVTITGAVAADTKGAWTELIASTSNAYVALMITIMDNSAGNVEYLIDIGIGGLGAETVLIENLPLEAPTTTDKMHWPIYVPIKVAAGTRLSARCQSDDGGSDTCTVSIMGFRGAVSLGFDTCETIGDLPADTGYTQIDPGAVADTKGAWVQLSVGITIDYAYAGLLALSKNLARTSCNWLVDIGIGDPGGEVVIVGNITLACHANYDKIMPMCLGMFPMDIPSGSKVSVRASCSITDATDRLLYLAVIGAGA